MSTYFRTLQVNPTMITFYGNDSSYIHRLKGGLPALLIISSFILVIYLKNPNLLSIYFLTFPILLFLIFISIWIIIKAKNNIREVQIFNDSIRLYGQSYSRNWELELGKDEFQISLKHAGSRFNIYYTIRIKANNKTLIINEHGDWFFPSVVDVFIKIKNLKNERLTLDERLILKTIAKE